MTQSPRKQTLFAELKQRNVFRVGIAYVVVAWLVLQIADVVLNNIAAPQWVFQVVLLLLGLGLPLALVFAWAFELTPEGVKRESEVDRSQSITHQTGRKLDFAIIAVLVVALGWFAWDKFGRQRAAPEPAAVAAVTAAPAAAPKAQKSIAVLPFVALSSGENDGYFADGLTEEILNALAQLPELLVTARTSSFHFKGQDVPLQDIAARLGVRFIVEGSVRRAGERLRVTAQLIRAADGFHLWSENYDDESADTLSVQEDIAEQIAIAMDVVLDDDKRQAMRRAGLRDVEAFIEFQKGEEYYNKAHGDMNQIEGLKQANRHYEAVLARVPDYGPAYVGHADLYVHLAHREASNQSLSGASAELVAAAPETFARDLAAAIKHARSEDERRNAEFELAFLGGRWNGLKRRIELVIANRGCRAAGWIHSIAMLSGIYERYLPRLTEIRTCNPLVPNSWFNEARALLWLGDAQSAVKLTRQGIETAPGGFLSHFLIYALAAAGQFDAADQEISDRIPDAIDVKWLRTLVAAARGESDVASALGEDYLREADASSYQAVQIHAWLGQRQKANLVAATIDQHRQGATTLMVVVSWCACGAPFDLEATPNLAAKLDEAGMSWPPPSPIRFPLKGW